MKGRCVTQANTIAPAVAGAPRLTAGFLLRPFGWAAETLAQFAARDPALLSCLFELDRERMHLIALALAHADGQPAEDFCQVLMQASLCEVPSSVLGHQPAGLRRALQHMPNEVLARESYRRLIDLLAAPTSGKVLRHAKLIDDTLIERLAEVPSPLHWLIPCWCSWLDGIADSLHFLADRTGLNFDELVLSLARIREPQQFVAKLKSIIETLPMPINMPPERIASARRLDTIFELRDLAKKWRNCLAGYADAINGGMCAVYLWEGSPPAACLVARHGRLGWFLDKVLGPRNCELRQEDLRPICEAFAEKGILRVQIIEAVETIVSADPHLVRDMMRRRPGRQFGAEPMEETWAGMD
jgi:hypothetical protein